MEADSEPKIGQVGDSRHVSRPNREAARVRPDVGIQECGTEGLAWHQATSRPACGLTDTHILAGCKVQRRTILKCVLLSGVTGGRQALAELGQRSRRWRVGFWLYLALLTPPVRIVGALQLVQCHLVVEFFPGRAVTTVIPDSSLGRR